MSDGYLFVPVRPVLSYSDGSAGERGEDGRAIGAALFDVDEPRD